MRHRSCVAVFALLLLSCGGTATPESDPAPTGTTKSAASGNVGIVAIGHSGIAGTNSDPGRPFEDVPANSWATGSNPDVESLATRLAAALPETAGHVANTARGGAEAAALRSQAEAALERVPAPRLLVIQTIDNDIRCDGSDEENVLRFGEHLADALRVVEDVSPATTVLVVSQRGRPTTYAASIRGEPAAVAANTGSGPCDLFDGQGQVREDVVAELTTIIEMYEAEQARVCAEFTTCRTDDRRNASFPETLDSLVSADWNHLTVQGLAAQAAHLWPVVEDVLGL